MKVFASCINEKGKESIQLQIVEAELNWSLGAVLSDIEERNAFMEAQPGDALDIESGHKLPTGHNHFWRLEADEIEFLESAE